MRGLLRKIKRRDAVLGQQARPEYLNIMLRGGRMTKVAGVAASFAPTLGSVGSTLSLGASSIALGTALSVSGAFAGNCGSIGGGAYVCIGPANPGVDVQQTFNIAGPLNVAMADGFGIDVVGGGNAFDLGGNPAGTSVMLTDIYGADITGGNNGIIVGNGNPASTDIDVNLAGTVTGVLGGGIISNNFGTGSTTISVTNATGTAQVTGRLTGIFAYSDASTTDMSITANNVTSSDNDGISLSMQGTGDVTVNVTNADGTGTVTADGLGIRVGNYGAGPGTISVTANNVYATNSYGIYAYQANGNGVTVTVDDVVSSTNGTGIRTFNNGTGDTVITTTNAAGDAYVFAGTTGINAYSGPSTGALTISTNNVRAYAGDGIYGSQFGSGDLTITATNAFGSARVEGSNRGIDARNYGTGALSITADDVYALNGDGIYAYASSDSTGVSVTVNEQSFSANDSGVYARNRAYGDTYINATNAAGNTYAAGTDYGIYAYGGFDTDALTIYADIVSSFANDGVHARHYGSGDLTINVTNAAGTGLANGNGRGIYARNDGTAGLSITVNNATGFNSDGIYANNGSSGTDLSIVADGQVVSTYSNGIAALNFGTGSTSVNATNLTGDALVSGSRGLYVYSDGSTTTSTITANNVTGTNGDGIYARHEGSGDLSITANNADGTAQVTGLTRGIYARNNNGGNLTITVDNVTGTNSDGIYAYSFGTDLSVTATGTVEGGSRGIYARNSGNGGLTINATNAAGDASVTGVSNGIYAYSDTLTGATSVSANNVTSTNSDGIRVRANGNGDTTVNATNAAGTANVTGYQVGIYAYGRYGNLFVTADNVTGTNREGIYARNAVTAGTIDITTTGTVSGDTSGIYAYSFSGDDVTVTATNAAGDASVIGVNDGIRVYNVAAGGAVTVTANNATSTLSDDGVYVNNRGSGDASVTVTNAAGTGTAQGYDYGVNVRNYSGGNASVTVDNATGQTQDGINIYNDGASGSVYVTAYGTVYGYDDGIVVDNFGSGGVTVTASNATGTAQVTSPNDYGLEINNQNGGAVDVTVDNVNAGYTGVYVNNDGAGTSVSLTVNGTVQADTYAVFLQNFGSEGVTVNATNADNSSLLTGDYGLYVTNYNGGAVDVTVDSVTGLTGDAIDIENDAAGTSVSVTAYGTVYGYDYGIEIDNDGSEGVTITATNPDGTAEVTSLDGDAIDVNNDNGGAVVVAVDNVYAYEYGIDIDNDTAGSTVTVTGTGNIIAETDDAIDINSDGTGGVLVDVRNADGTAQITSDEDHGIDIDNDNGGAVRVFADNVSGDDEAIEIDNDSDGLFVSVTITGDVTAGNQEGIDIDNDGVGGITIVATNADNSSQITALDNEGILADNNNGGAVDITVDNVTSDDEGIEVTNDSDGTTVAVTVYGYVLSYGDKGIEVDNDGSGDVTVTVSNADGTAQVTSGDDDAIDINNDEGGAVVVTADNINGYDDGIFVDNDFNGTYTSVTLNNSATATQYDAIDINHDGSEGVTVTAANADGTVQITAGDNGIEVDNDNGGAVVIAADNIAANADGIQADNDVDGTSMAISVYGVIDAAYYGVEADNRGSEGMTITGTNSTNSVQINGGRRGVDARNYNGGAVDITVDNAAGTNYAGVYGYNDNTGTSLSLTAYGTLTGGEYGADLFNDGTGDLIVTLTNADGTALADGGISGINARNYNGGVLVISADNATGGTQNGIYAYNDVNGLGLAISSTGTVEGGVNGTYARNIGVGGITILATNPDGTAQTTGGDFGILASNYNGGALAITADNVTGTARDGIGAYNDGLGSSLTVTTLGDVIAGDDGIDANNDGSGDLLVQASNPGGTASVTGADAGIIADNNNGGAVTVIADNVTGTASSGIVATNDGAGSTVSVTTYGDILGAQNGIEAFNAGTGLLSVTSSGGVDGTAGYGIYTFAGPAGTTRITLEDGADVTGGLNAIFNDGGDSDSYFNDGSTVSQGVVLNDGSDDLTIANADITGVTVLDGGDDSDVADGFIDLLTFSGFDGSFGADLLNWEGVIFDESNATFTGAAITTPTMALTNN
ncbi:MAG: hypothetical protein AAF382_14575, partial [Pseudomonadota bacterium]